MKTGCSTLPAAYNEEMVTGESTQPYRKPDLAKLAAALAAVTVSQTASTKPAPPKSSCWAAASLLESAILPLKPQLSPLPQQTRSNLWRSASHTLLIIMLCCTFASATLLPVCCQQQDPPGSSPATATQQNVYENKPTAVRIALVLGSHSITVELPDGAQLISTSDNTCLTQAPLHSRFTFQADDQLGVVWHLGTTDRQFKSERNRASWHQASYTVKPLGADTVFGLNGKLYRGSILICHQANGSGINAINILDIEEYLLSVVPAEMPSTWPLEALKAQAVAARSYAMANLGKHASDGYDLKSTTEDQVYPGVATESRASNQAVAETDGLVLKHNGQIIAAFFHSTSGGFTESPQQQPGRSLPYLKSVPDYDDKSPLFTWSQIISVQALEESFQKSGYNLGNLLAMFVISRGHSARTRNVIVVGSTQTKLLSGEEVRRLLNLPSTNFNLGCNHESYLIAGRGAGHGLGLSQWGAKTLAENGYNAAQILTYYYKDVSLDYL